MEYLQEIGDSSPNIERVATPPSRITGLMEFTGTVRAPRFPFNVYVTRQDGSQFTFAISPGAVNEQWPTLNGQPLIGDPEFSLNLGIHRVYLKTTLDVVPTSPTYLEIQELVIEILSGDTPVPVSTQEVTYLRLAYLDIVSTGSGQAVPRIINEVFGSLQIIFFYDRMMFLPTFAAPTEYVTA